MSQTGATEQSGPAQQPPREAAPDRDRTSALNTPGNADHRFLPDLCSARSVLVVILVAQLLAIVLTLARPAPAGLLVELSGMSLLVQWFALTSAALLCVSRSLLQRLAVPLMAVAVLALILTNTAALSVAAWWLGQWLRMQGLADSPFPAELMPFLLRNSGIAAIVTALVLRYFFIAHQWRLNTQAEARARLQALQARIRPHFLFNALNTVASLTRDDPVRAEEAIEDLADLLRATLTDRDGWWPLSQELDLARAYERIERLRLGERLRVQWNTMALPPDARVPLFTIQPLIENAIHHGIARLNEGGTVAVTGTLLNGHVEVCVSNPVSAEADGTARSGHGVALANIRQRLALAYGAGGRMKIRDAAGEYAVTVRFPYQR